nr:N-acetylmuramoyl-L-alanine amidase [Segnochrobactrum spirostomi]
MKIARDVVSPNHGPRPQGLRPDILLLHYTGMPTAAAAIARLCDPLANVSSHYVVDEDGAILRLVPEARRAHHAGVSSWQGTTDINSRSIGIEIVNPGHEFGYRPFPDAQIEAVIALCRDILARQPIAPERVLAHSDVAPERKQDPGELFPWDRLAAAGIGRWVEPSPIADGPAFRRGDEGLPIRALQAMLAHYGYGLDLTGVFDARTEAVVTAFQRHFRPARVDGVADRSTFETLHRLAG